MTADYHPLLALLLTVSALVSCAQQRTIEYLVEESRVLKEPLKGRPTRFVAKVHFRAINRRCQRIRVSGVAMVGTLSRARRPRSLAFAANLRR
jgi:hypothetical protein